MYLSNLKDKYSITAEDLQIIQDYISGALTKFCGSINVVVAMLELITAGDIAPEHKRI